MSKKEIQNILEAVKNVIYPEVVKRDFAGEDIVMEKLEDMTCIFRVETSSADNLYLKLKLGEILEAGGYNVHKIAFANYRRDLSIIESNVLHHGKNNDIELTLLTGSLNMGAILFCRELLEEVKKFYGGDFIILGVLQYGIVITGVSERTGGAIDWMVLHEEVKEEMQEPFLTDSIFAYKEGQLKVL